MCCSPASAAHIVSDGDEDEDEEEEEEDNVIWIELIQHCRYFF